MKGFADNAVKGDCARRDHVKSDVTVSDECRCWSVIGMLQSFPIAIDQCDGRVYAGIKQTKKRKHVNGEHCKMRRCGVSTGIVKFGI